MYTLRKVKRKETINHYLGKDYVYVDRFSNEDSFRKHYNNVFKENHEANLDYSSTESSKNVLGFLITDIIYPIYKDESAYIMTENGKTFERLNQA